MSTKRLLALLFSTAFIVPGVALADPPTRCDNELGFNTPGAWNQRLKDKYGPPGQNDYEVAENVFLPANEFVAQIRNPIRKGACPPPGHNKPD